MGGASSTHLQYLLLALASTLSSPARTAVVYAAPGCFILHSMNEGLWDLG